MRPFSIGTFKAEHGDAFPGLVIGDDVFQINQELLGSKALPPQTFNGILGLLDEWENVWPLLNAAARQLAATGGGTKFKLASLKTLAPVRSRQIICAGANYRKHVIDVMVDHPQAGIDPSLAEPERRILATRIMDHRASKGQPFAFSKPVSCLLDPFEELELPADSNEVDWELELGVIIGKPARRVPRERAMEYVAGYTIVNDISARDHLGRPDFPSIGMDWIACKSAPGFLPMGPTIVPAAFVDDPQKLQITLRLNGEVMQDESTADMIFPIARLIEFISTHMQLLPGDVICTGSPSGNGTPHNRFLRNGDLLEGEIEGLGAQRTRCVDERLVPGAILHRPFVPLGAA